MLSSLDGVLTFLDIKPEGLLDVDTEIREACKSYDFYVPWKITNPWIEYASYMLNLSLPGSSSNRVIRVEKSISIIIWTEDGYQIQHFKKGSHTDELTVFPAGCQTSIWLDSSV